MTVKHSAAEALAARLEGLSPAKRAFVEQKLREARARDGAAAGIPHLAEGVPVPLSFGQELLWRIEQAEPGTSTYNVPRALEVRGVLDVMRLQRALDGLVQRHAVLRTSFMDGAEGPRQVVQPARPVELRVVQCGDAEVEQVLRAAASEPFDLSRDLLLRATLARGEGGRQALLIVSHHIASDGASGGVLLSDLAAMYDGASLAPLPIQFADFAAWQRAELTEPRVQSLLGYWRERLAGAPARLELPTDRPRAAAPGFDGARRSGMLSRQVADGVRDVARANGVTPFVVLLAAFQALLNRYSRQDDIVVGTVVTGRGRPELEGLAGYFSNTLPVRATFEGDPTFTELVGRVRAATLGANEHADLPYEMLALKLRGAAAGQASLFDVMFAMIDESAALPSLGDAALAPIALDRGISKFDLTLAAAMLPDGVKLGMEYRTELFDDATIARMTEHYGVLLAAAVASPATQVSQLPILAPAERALVVDAWNETTVEYPLTATLVTLLADQAARTPDATAVMLANEDGAAPVRASLTFAELDARADTLARALVARGVQRGDLVGVCMERSLELVISLVGIIKAGAAYVPMDPEYPADRLAYMLEDSRCPVLLTQSSVASTTLAALPMAEGASPVRRLLLDTEWSSVEADAARLAAPLPEVAPDDLAYMIYTSGSTGRPKGALNRHRGIVNRVLWMQSEYRLGERDVVLQKTPFSFDVSVWEFFLPLMSGAPLLLAAPGGHRDPAYLVDTIATHGVTVMHFVPSMLRAFLEEPTASRATTLRDVMASGEALPYELQQRFFATLPGANLHNLYGPTECAVDVSYWACRRDDARHVVPIGRPVANTQLYVLDAHMAPVPIGVAGELYLGGVQVGAGYWNRPELTDERFVPDPFDRGRSRRFGGARLYRTGDLARWLPDGVVEYLGRLDFQVKLRGFRIELGEIESALASHPAVREAVVVAREDLPGGPMLVAYFAARGDDVPAASALRTHLRDLLPEYMVPSAFVALDALPLSPSGKVDRKALPVPTDLAPVEREYVAPRTPTEQRVADVWGEVLGADRIGATDDFFDVGGHSLLAMRVVGRLHALTGVRVSFRELFTLRTVEALARRIDGADAARQPGDEVIVPRADRSRAPLSFAQELIWLHAQMHPESSTYNVPMAFRVHGPLDVQRLRSALVALAERHEVLRTTFAEGDEGGEQRIGAAEVDIEEIDVSGRSESRREGAAMDVVRRAAVEPFDIARGPLLRATVVRIAPEESILVLVLHHIVFDGTSARLLLEDLSALHDGMAPSALPAIGAQYGDYAAWQRGRLRGDRMEELRAFWKTELEGAPTRVPLSRSGAGTSASTEGRRVEAFVASSVLPALRRIGRERDASLYMVMLAAFQSLLHRVADTEDIVVGSPLAGRQQPEIERTIGMFANALPMRARFDATSTFDSVVRATRDACLRVFAHQEMPYEQLVLDRRGAVSDDALFSVLFVQQEDRAALPMLGDATLTPMPASLDSAKFDVALSVADHGDAIRASLHYRVGVLDDASARALLARFDALLEAVAEQPMRSLRELDIGDLTFTGEASASIATAGAASNGNGASHGEAAYAAPEGPIEEVIAGVWSEVLGRTRISRDASFLEAGGHSLLATRVVARVGTLLRARIPMRTFFANPTIRGLALSLAAAEEKPGQAAAVARAVLKLRSMSAADRTRLAASQAATRAGDN